MADGLGLMKQHGTFSNVAPGLLQRPSDDTRTCHTTILDDGYKGGVRGGQPQRLVKYRLVPDYMGSGSEACACLCACPLHGLLSFLLIMFLVFIYFLINLCTMQYFINYFYVMYLFSY